MATNTSWPTYTAIFFLLPAFVSATASESVLTIMRSCAAQADDAARLRCYDRAVARFKDGDERPNEHSNISAAEGALTQAPVRVTEPAVSGPTNTAAPADLFGLTAGQALRKQSGEERSQPLKRLSAQIVASSRKPDGNLILHLDNGQVWEQAEEGPDLHLGPGDLVMIDRGVLGAYWLSAHSSRRVIKVRRKQ